MAKANFKSTTPQAVASEIVRIEWTSRRHVEVTVKLEDGSETAIPMTAGALLSLVNMTVAKVNEGGPAAQVSRFIAATS